MDREYLLAILAPLVAGPMLLASGWWRHLGPSPSEPRRLERSLWRNIWLPLTPSATLLLALIGWAIVEPDQAEALPFGIVLLAVPFALLWARAILRAGYSAVHLGPSLPAATVGLLRPRVMLSPRLLAELDDDACLATLEHELAHARHRDPLRIWAAQFACDLQWPWPRASRRFREWLRALELARDEEARRRGIEGSDLAAAVIAAARLQGATVPACGLVGDEAALRDRVERLLAPLPSPSEDTKPPRLWPLMVPAQLGLAPFFGLRFGEIAIRGLLRLFG